MSITNMNMPSDYRRAPLPPAAAIHTWYCPSLSNSHHPPHHHPGRVLRQSSHPPRGDRRARGVADTEAARAAGCGADTVCWMWRQWCPTSHGRELPQIQISGLSGEITSYTMITIRGVTDTDDMDCGIQRGTSALQVETGSKPGEEILISSVI